MKYWGILAIFFLAFIVCVSADTCISTPDPVGLGESCGGTLKCRRNAYCNIDGVCHSYAKIGEHCDQYISCEIGSICKGPTAYQQCISNAEIGDSCSSGTTITIPTCLRTCNGGVCQGALYGDSCTTNADCIPGLFCSSVSKSKSVCANFSNLNCTTALHCPPSKYCSGQLCVDYVANGQSCNSTMPCFFKSACIPTSAGSTVSTCVAYESLAAGTYSANNAYVCKSQRQVNGYCTKGTIKICQSSSECGVQHSCRCSGKPIYDGMGTCSTDSCASKQEKYYSCMFNNCAIQNPVAIVDTNNNFEGSCRNLQCNSEYDSYAKCNSALIANASIFTVTLGLIFVFFFNKSN